MLDERTCPHCGAVNPADATACRECHQPLDPARLELRHGTFLFCDLVGSTRLIQRLDPDGQVQVMQALRQAVLGVVERSGGRNERFDGDGYFVSFVGPDTREDDAMAAIRTGLDVASAVAAAGQRIGQPLQMRVGIASGAVVVGRREDRTVMPDEGYIGASINLAKRLASKAPPGRVAVADATRRLAGRFFEYEPIEGLELSDFEDEVRAWTVSGGSQVASRFVAAQDARPIQPIIGREAELAALKQAWHDAAAGKGRAVLLRGEAGIGKSRLAHEVRALAVAAGASLIELDCTARAVHTPFYPVAVQLRRMAGVPEASSAASGAQQVSQWLAGTLGERAVAAVDSFLPVLLAQAQAQATAAAADQTVERATAALVEWISGRSARQPVLVLAEDLHWADAATLELLSRLAAACAGHPMLVLATSRPGTLVPASLESGVIELGPLDEPSSQAVVRHALGDATLSPPMLARVVQRCEGIPLYLQEMARASQDEKGLEAIINQGGSLPGTLAILFQARLGRSPERRRVVQAASVLGREFSLALLQRLLGQPSGLSEIVTALIDDGLLDRPGEGPAPQLRFRHALILEAVYQSLLLSDRRALHSHAADVLALHFAGDPIAAPDILAHHQAIAQRFDEASRNLLAAGSAAAAHGAFQDAAAHARAGLANAAKLAESGEQRHLQRQLYTLLGMAVTATAGYAADEVEQAYLAARQLSRGDDDPVALFPIVRGLGTFNFVRARFDEAQAIAVQCVALANAAGRTDFLIEALSFLGYTELYRGHVDAARAALEDCVDRYRRENGASFTYPSPQDAGTSALSLLPAAAWLQGDVGAADQRAAEALAHARGLKRPIDEAYALVWIAMLRNLQRRHAEAIELSQACLAISQAHGFRTWLAAATMQQCFAAGALGPSEQAVGTLHYVLGEFKKAGAEANEPYFLWGAAEGSMHLGQPDGARQALETALQRTQVTGESYLRAELLLAQARAGATPPAAQALRRQALDEARAQGATLLALRAALAELEATGASSASWPSVLATAAEVLRSGGVTPPATDAVQGFDAAQAREALAAALALLAAAG